jgi:TolB protein
VPTATETAVPTATRTPTATASPTPDPRRRVVAFASDWAGDDDVYLLDLESGALVRVTHAPGEDRDPVFAPDGRYLFYRSNAGGTWAFYGIDLATGERAARVDGLAGRTAFRGKVAQAAGAYVYEAYRDGNLDLCLYSPEGTQWLTEHAAGDYDPAWRPGTSQIAFASWREGSKDLYLVDVGGGEPRRLTTDPADEESPAWHPDGLRMAFVRWVDGDADLYELDLANGEVARLTADPYPDRDPSYGPDGTLFWTRYAPGMPFEVHDPYRPGQWQLWMRSPDGREQSVALLISDMDVYAPAAGYALWPDLPPATSVAPTATPTIAPGQTVALTTLDIACAGKYPRIHAHLAEAYEAWRAEVRAQTGYDILGNISDMFRPLGYGGRDYGHLSWHRTGRALDLLFEWPGESGETQLLVVREDLGPQTYWRLYVKALKQDGTMGEPLTDVPWIFWFELDPAKEAAAYAAGGKPGEVPTGYYVDLTRLARRHGWHRIASYEEEDFDWRTDSVGREFWHYQRTDGLTWWEAMSQIYPLETLEQYYGWTVCTEKLGMDPAWLRAKGIPTPSSP